MPRVRVDASTKRTPGGLTVIGATKTKAARRTIALPSYAASIVKQHLEKYVPDEIDALLYSAARGDQTKPMDGRAFNRELKKACLAAGVPLGRFHDLRHSSLTLYGQSGASIAELMARAGHDDMEAVRIYQHATAERDAELAEKMM